MPQRPFRFIHAADFHLEMPAHGLTEVPSHLRELFLEAPYSTARRVFDAALAEEAEFLVLAGDILNPLHAGPRGPVFLLEQFARLAEKGIKVYWAGGEADPPESWPPTLPLPENVRVFPRGQTAEVVHLRDDAPLARLVGISRDAQRPIRPAEFTPDPAGSFSIAVAHGEADAGALQARRMDYWALGGRHDRAALFTAPQVAHYPGSPQGRCPQEAGAHGCTLVQVDEQGHARTTPLPTDVLRWLTELVPLDESSTRSSLEGLLRQRVQNLLETAPKVDLMISWAVSGSGPLIADLRRGSLAAELLAGLRNEYGGGRPAAWSVSLEAEPPAALPHSWYEQETFLGDFLRAVRQLEMNPSESLELDSYVSEAHQAGSLGSALAVTGPAARGRVLRQAAWLGVDLLGGEQLQQEQRP